MLQAATAAVDGRQVWVIPSGSGLADTNQQTTGGIMIMSGSMRMGTTPPKKSFRSGRNEGIWEFAYTRDCMEFDHTIILKCIFKHVVDFSVIFQLC